MKLKLLIPAFATLAIVGMLSVPGSASAKRGEAGLGAVRAFTDQYHSEAAAVADGFQPTDECVPGMGYHYLNISRIDDRLQPNRPESLLYASTADGGRELAGAEWLVIDRDQDLSTDDDRPSLFGHDFDGPMPGHVPGMPIHYDLHAYAWVTNRAGAFATWNATMTCPDA